MVAEIFAKSSDRSPNVIRTYKEAFKGRYLSLIEFSLVKKIATTLESFQIFVIQKLRRRFQLNLSDILKSLNRKNQLFIRKLSRKMYNVL